MTSNAFSIGLWCVGVSATLALGGCAAQDPLDTFVPLNRTSQAGVDPADYGPWFSVAPDRIGLQVRVSTRRKPPSGERFVQKQPRVVDLKNGKAAIAPAAIAKIRTALDGGKFKVSARDTVSVAVDQAITVDTLRLLHTGIGLAGITRSKLVMANVDNKRTALELHPFSRLALGTKNDFKKTVVALRKQPTAETFVAAVADSGKTFELLSKRWASSGSAPLKCPLTTFDLATVAETVCKNAPTAEVALDVPDDTTVEALGKLAAVFRAASCSPPVTPLARSSGEALLANVTCEAKANTTPPASAPTSPPPVPEAILGWKAVGKAVVEGLTPVAADAVRKSLVAQHRAVFECVPPPSKGQTLVSVQIAPVTDGATQAARAQVSVASAPGIDATVQSCIAKALAPVRPTGTAYRIARVWLRTAAPAQ